MDKIIVIPEQTEKEILENELGAMTLEIIDSNEDEKIVLEQKYEERINIIINRLEEIESNG